MKQKQFQRCGVHLPVKNLQETIEYYRNTLGFYDEWTYSNTDGGTRRDNLRLLFSENPEHTNLINGKHRLPLLWFADNIDEVYAELKERIHLADELKLHSYGLREFAFIDVNGYYIRVAESTDAS